tara:strand:+ start:167 stop:1795 length:1629 start_codon:yes stop_codon:yes gene_type:complete
MQRKHYGVWPKNLPYSLPASPDSVYKNLVNSAKNCPSTVAIKFYGKDLTFYDLYKESQLIAGYLFQIASIRENDRVALYMQNSPQFIIAYYAILAANAVIVPINPMCKSAELAHIVYDSQSKAIIFGDELYNEIINANLKIGERQLLAATYHDYIGQCSDIEIPASLTTKRPTPTCSSWRTALELNLSKPDHNRTPDDWCIIPYSSGTTGQPKGCLHTHRSVNATIFAYPRWVGVKNGSQVLATLPLCHVTGMQHSMNLPILTASTIHLMTRWNAQAAAEIIENEKIQHWRSITTTMIDFLSLKNIEKYDLSSLEAIGGGGAQMPESVAERMEKLIGLDYIEAYGLTETMAPIHINPVNSPRRQCLGIPIFDVDTRIIEPQSCHELGPNEIGEIVTSAPQIFAGYWQNEEATNNAFVSINGKDFFRTGDIGYYDDDGYFYFVDRLKRMINVSGLKVWPAEVEAILHSHPAISEACVVGDPDPRTGERVRAVVVLVDPLEVLTEGSFIDWCGKNMANYKIPRNLDIRKELPRGTAGKVLWKNL